MTLRMRRRASKLFLMNEGRKSQIVLLDERRLDIIIQPKLYSSELLDLVASHFKLKEKQYFGLGFIDDTHHFNWLQGEKRVLDHEFPKKTGLLVLHFAIKFYVDTIGLLRDIQTVELFYLNARQLVFRGQLECDTETVFELAAHVLQATSGDFVSDEETKEELKKLPVIPTCTLKQHPSIAYCEDRVIHFYEKISGTSRGLAIVNYMTIVEKLPTYGIHYYDVKDKKDIPWWLGISPKGIAVYDKNDKTTPRKLFTWKNLENLYYRDKKFSIEVHGPKRDETGSHIIHTLSSFSAYEDAIREPSEGYDDLSSAITDPTTQVSVSRRTFGASNVDVHAWFASTPQLTKCIWSMAVVQHQFYLDRKQSRSQLSTARSMSEIAADLCRSTSSLPGSVGSDLSRSPSSHSLPSLSNSRYDLTIEQSDSLKAERDMFQALKARREALEDTLRKKLEELKLLCLQEGELTGELPQDFPLTPGEQLPVFRRRVGTAFSLSVKNVHDTDQLSSELSKLELEVELQGKITAAAHRLASDKTVSKYVRKQRRQSYSKSLGKLKDMEKKLDDMRKKMGKPSSGEHHTSRSLDGMYSVPHSRSKCDLDIDRSMLVHELCTNKQDYSCGNRGQAEDLNVHSDCSSSKYTSSGYLSSSTGSPGSRYRDIMDDTHSFSDSVSTTDSSSFTSGEHLSLNVGDNPRRISTPTRTDSQSLQQVQPGRKRHFIVSRGHNGCFTELRESLCPPELSSSIKSDDQENSDFAATEPDHDVDESADSSLQSNSICDVEEREKYCTRVQRRQQTFIASRAVLESFHVEAPKCNGFERGWKMFEHILMGDGNFCEPEVNEKQQVNNTLCRHEDTVQAHRGPKRSSGIDEVELSQKIQELIQRDEPRKPVRRSRSFDYTHDLRVCRGNNSEHVGDELNVDKRPTKSKDHTSHMKNPFVFLTRRRNKPREVKCPLNDTQTSVLYDCAAAVAPLHVEVSPCSTESSAVIANRLKTDSEHVMTEVPVQNSTVRNTAFAQSSDIVKHYTESHRPWHRSSTAARLCPQSSLKSARLISGISDQNQQNPRSDCNQGESIDSNSMTVSHAENQYPRRRSSWCSNKRSNSLSIKSKGTIV